MAGAMLVAAASCAFVGTHFMMSHPLRRPLVAAMGERGFAGLYSLVAFVTLGAMVWAWRVADAEAPLWPVGDGLWAVATVLVLVASVLLMGSVVRNPAMVSPGAARQVPAEAQGVFAITRHPMMWAVAIWGASHILVYPLVKTVILSAAVIVLALVGAAFQDAKKAALDPAGWPAWQARTSYWPFAAIASGRARLRWPGAHAVFGGVVVWLVATWAHIPLAGWPAGIWRWLG